MMAHQIIVELFVMNTRKDSRIRVIHKTNGGLSDARNVVLMLLKVPISSVLIAMIL